LRNKIGVVLAVALATVWLAVFLARPLPRMSYSTPSLTRSSQILKVAQTEKFQTDLRFAETNAEAAQLVGNDIKLGRVNDGGPVVEMNVREGGVIEFLLNDRDRGGQPLRAIFLPMMVDPHTSTPFQWQCFSANWEKVAELDSDCRYDPSAWELERQHVMRLRAAAQKMELEWERSREKSQSEQAAADFDRQRAQLARESERAREEEQRELARIERETERARIEYERQKRHLPQPVD
jgi:hypothetical protein